MSWLRSSPLRQSFTKSGHSGNASSRSGAGGSGGGMAGIRPFDATDCDPKACYDSFCIHWQQAYEIILRSENYRSQSHDDVLGVVTHLDHMVTLLLMELHHCNKLSLPGQTAPPAPCLEHLLSENLLDKLYEWGIKTGRYANAVRLEQLKLYEQLVSHSRHQLLVHEPFLRPLLKLLASSQNEIYPPDVEKRLVILLNQLCVVLMQNVHLLDLFFFSTTQTQTHSQQTSNGGHTNFIIFSLLIPYVHREGSLGHQARDALLLCMALSQKNSNVGTYIATYSSICPVLVTGLGGLYSRLPNQIEIKTVDWYRITTDDVTELPELTLFMNSLEFCNAVVQVAHSMIRQQLLDFLYQGFLVPVLGPAILQTFKGQGQFQTNVESQVSAMAYFDLIVRSITEPGLIQLVVRFLLDEEKFDGQRILDVLVERLNSNDSRLCMVTLSLFDSLLSLNCEDIMLELMLKYLLHCKHVPISHRYKINRVDPYTQAVEYFLNITPDIMRKVNSVLSINNNNNTNGLGASQSSGASQRVITTNTTTPAPTSANGLNGGAGVNMNVSKTIGANWNHYGLNTTTGETLLANYQAYLLDARTRIAQCKHACDQWNNVYRYQKLSKANFVSSSGSGPAGSPNGGSVGNSLENAEDVRTLKVQMIKSFLSEFSSDSGTFGSIVGDQPVGVGTGTTSNASMFGGAGLVAATASGGKQLDSLQSIGDSSGYESLNVFSQSTSEQLPAALVLPPEPKHQRVDTWKISNVREEPIGDLDLSEDLFAQGTVSLGPFLTAIWGKLQTFTSNCMYVNLHLTGLISHLTLFPLPLLHSILLRPDIPTTSDTPSFHQVLKILKQQIDAELPDTDESLEIADVARTFLVDREFRLVNMRKNAIESAASGGKLLNGGGSSMTSSLSQTTPMQLTPSSSYDPFKRQDSKRKSITNSFSNIFRRPGSVASSGLAQIVEFFTGSSNGNGLNHSPNGRHPQSLTAGSSTNFSGHQQQQPLSTPGGTGTSGTGGGGGYHPPTSGLLVSGGGRRESREAETQFMSFETPSNAPAAVAPVHHSSSGMVPAATGGNNELHLHGNSLEHHSSLVNYSVGASERQLNLAIGAVLLDEWLRELSAITQEQCIMMLSEQVQHQQRMGGVQQRTS
ncbi:FHIP family protein AGAP011705 [Anopheles ziemanni]|uniref:FHIP family protein AGAP011705 n=1 Tax=Anopheles coustani TaxID=139045 RepID=UPI00265A74A5|nr:FHIP family protein AGAP011705 [Anopheles coustani]XP_058173701.1 FHIP family protein AGAP011705 [Anopheles ziemanni]